MTLDLDTAQGFVKIQVIWHGSNSRKAPLGRRAGCLPPSTITATPIAIRRMCRTKIPRLTATTLPFLRNGIRFTLLALQRGKFVIVKQKTIGRMQLRITLTTGNDEFLWLVLITKSRIVQGNILRIQNVLGDYRMMCIETCNIPPGGDRSKPQFVRSKNHITL